MRPLFIRVDANAQIGSGHVMRCVALAQAWQAAAGPATFLVSDTSAAMRERIKAYGFGVKKLSAQTGSRNDAEQTAAAAGDGSSAWLVVDGYRFDAAYQNALKNMGKKVLVIDDCGHADLYVADLVLNQNIHADDTLYVNRGSGTSLLLGPRYVMLRQEFNRWRGHRRNASPVVHKLMVTLGGADPENITARVLKTICGLGWEGLQTKVVVGADNPHYNSLQAVVDESGARVYLVRDAKDMPALMEWADAAVTAGGSTCYEMSFMGLPSVVLVFADNQRPVAEGLDRYGAVINLGSYQTASTEQLITAICDLALHPSMREAMIQKGQRLIDGKGSDRVVSTMLSAVSEPHQTIAQECAG